MKKFASLFITLGFTLSSCIGPVPLDPGFKQARGTRVAVITMEAPKATVFHVGGQGVLDYAINQATASGRIKQLSDYPSQAKLDELGARFTSRLNAAGYKAAQLSVHPTIKEINPVLFKAGPKKALPGRDTYLQGYDAALYLQMPMVGQQQLVYGFIPLSGRSPFVMLQGAMYAQPGGRRLWRSPLSNLRRVSGTKSDDIFQGIDAEVEAKGRLLEADFFRGL
jgi:hypothetical protein